jgi:sphinganine-1-phosphate aldolase
MYRNTELRRHQYFAQPEWPGGIYVSPTMAGSRAGSLIAITWATLMSFGHDGYVAATKRIIETTRYIADGYKKKHALY